MRWLRNLWAKLRRWWRRLWTKKPKPIENFELEIIDMNIVGTWVLPTVRESGRPLPVSEISHTVIDVSLDGGVNWTELAQVPAADPQTFTVPDAEAGDWAFRGTVVDTNDRRGASLQASVTVPDETPPGVITDFEITLE